MRLLLSLFLALLLNACATPQLRGTGDLGLIIERSSGHVTLVNTTSRQPYARISGLGDLSHASAVYSRDGRYAFIFGRDGGLTKIDLLEAKIVKRIIQSGNAIGGSISQDGRIVVAQNYTPGGIKAFDADTLELLSEVPAEYAPGQVLQGGRPGRYRRQQVRLCAVRGRRDSRHRFQQPEAAQNAALPGWQAALRRPGHAGWPLFPGRSVRRGRRGHARPVAAGKGRAQDSRKLRPRPGKAAGVQDAAPARLVGGAGKAYLPAIGRHEVLVVDVATWKEVGRIPVRGQPVFVMARPDGRQIWVNFAFPDNGKVDVIDTLAGQVVHAWSRARASCTWNSRRAAKMSGCRPAMTTRWSSTTPRPSPRWARFADSPSGIFFTTRAARTASE
jgi:protein NirF